MAAKVNYIIGKSMFEVVTTQIAMILALELANQRVLLTAAILTETDLEKKAEMELSLSCIPTKVYEERFHKPGVEELPFVNVMFTRSPLNDLITNSTQGGDVQYTVESWQNAKSSESLGQGDSLSIKKLKRFLGTCNTIIMDHAYINLGFENPAIGYRQCNELVVGQPDTGGDDSNNSTYGKFDITVKMSEAIPDTANLPLVGSDTNININSTGNGYYWEVTYS